MTEVMDEVRASKPRGPEVALSAQTSPPSLSRLGGAACLLPLLWVPADDVRICGFRG